MSPAERAELVRIAAQLGLELVALFGSLAAGVGRDDSDADLAVRAGATLGGDERREIGERMRAVFGRDVDVVALRTADPGLLHGIFRHPLLLRGDEAVFAAERLRAFHRYEDYRPMLALERRALRAGLGLRGD